MSGTRKAPPIYHTLGFRLLVPLLTIIVVMLVVFAIFSIRSATDEWSRFVENCARRTSDLVGRSTHYSMLLNRKEEVSYTIRRLGDSPGVVSIRVYDKSGRVAFSDDEREVGTAVNIAAPECIACHPGGRSEIGHLRREQIRRFTNSSGDSILGLINPIENEPSCAGAECHPQPSEQAVLGVLDVHMSMSLMESALQDVRTQVAWFTLLIVILITAGTVVFFHLVVNRPIRKLFRGTERVAAGDLDTHIETHTKDELGQLAGAFNRMTDGLKSARGELTSWSDTLEQKVVEKTAELGRVQRHVVQIEKMASLGKLSATVAHELNNPLAGILNYARLSERELTDLDCGATAHEDLRRFLSFIQKESSRCGDIVRNLLLFARPSGGEFAPAHLAEIVDRSVMLVRHHLDMHDIDLQVDLPEGDDELVCDPAQVQQALVALLINAVEAMGANTDRRLTIHAEVTNETMKIRVTDTGVGIAETTLPLVFEPFFSTKEKESGVGLGLAVVYGIVHRHGGRIEVESKLGRGTSFIISLPRRSTGPRDSSPETPPASSDPSQ